MSVVCLLCTAELTPWEHGFYSHPPVDDCLVEVCDELGVPISNEDIEKRINELSRQSETATGIDLTLHPFVDKVLEEIFVEYGVDRLGGASTGRGWSSINLFQKCPYAWKRRYIERAQPLFLVESQAIAVGSLVHAYLAVQYIRGMFSDYPLTPDLLHERVRLKANPEYAQEAWRIYTGYRLFYKYDNFTPLAVEADLKDPRTGESCRFDLVAYFAEEAPMRLPGTYIIEHKTKQRFDRAALDGWTNDGEILGQVMLWERLGLAKRFGELRGVIINLLGRQKDPQFERVIVAPSKWQIGQHKEDLKRWEGAIQFARATNNFPRSRHSCIDRYGFCEWWGHCSETPMEPTTEE